MSADIKITRDEFFEFIKKGKETPASMSRSTKHYLDYFDKVKSTGRRINWNWAACLPAVFFYRRMYAMGISILMAGRLLDKLLSLLFARVSFSGWEDTVDLTVTILFIALCMGYTDYMYLQHANHQVLKGKLRGGVSTLALGIWVVLFIAGVLLLLLKPPSV